MVRCRTLGVLELHDSSTEEHLSVLSQPKRAALLVYLAAATPRGFHRRDTLLALFWPDSDQEHARAALRQSLTFLRHELGPEVIQTRGGEDVGVDPERLWCDVVAFEEGIRVDDLEHGLEFYRGDFLAGFHLSGCGAFEEWVEGRRRELRDVAVDAVTRMIAREETRGSITGAVQWARRRVRLMTDDERALQRLLRLLDRGGDRAGALREYDAFARRLAAEYGAEPSPETQALIAEIRARGAAAPHEGGSGRTP